MYWFEILMLVDKHNEFIENQNSETDSQNDVFAAHQQQMENMYKNQQNNMPKYEMPKMPDMGSFNFNNLPNFGS